MSCSNKRHYFSRWGHLLRDKERATKASVPLDLSPVWKREPGEQERGIHSFTDLFLACDLSTRLSHEQGDRDLHNATTPNDCFFYKITKASHKSAVLGTGLKEQTHMPQPESHQMMTAIRCHSTEKLTSSNELCWWDGSCGVMVVFWFGFGFF